MDDNIVIDGMMDFDEILPDKGTDTGTGTEKPKRRSRKTGADPADPAPVPGTGKRKRKTGTRKTRKGTGKGTGTGTDKEPGMEPGTEKKKQGRPKGSKSGYTVSKTALAQRQKNAEVINTASNGPFDGEAYSYNARNIDHVIKIHEISLQADRKDPVSLRSCFLAYLRLCQQDGFKPGNLAAYTAMGINKNILEQWIAGKDPEYKQLALFVKQTCSMIRETMVTDGKINPVIGIFWQRNYDGLRNDTEQLQSMAALTATDNETEKTSDDYIKQYGKLVDD